MPPQFGVSKPLNPWVKNPPKSPEAGQPGANPLVDQYKLYNTAVQQQAGDYGDIMRGYQNVMNTAQPGYIKSPDVQSAISNLGGLAQTGGYTEQDQANIRARGISPIRSVYAGAQRDIDRSRSLAGGYSPNYAAVKAKMAREMSDTIANQVTNVNAGLAESIARNRLSASPGYASAAQAQNALENQMQGQGVNNQLQALGGMSSLYGTTPALASTFGNQAQGAAQLQSNIDERGQQGRLNTIGQLMRGLG